METITRKQLRQLINDKYDSIPERQVSPGIYIKTVGYKYVTLCNTWGTTTLEKIPLEEFARTVSNS